MQDVAEAVGMTKAGLYHYFPTKRAMFDSIVLSTLMELIEASDAAVAAHQDHAEKLTAFMIAHADYLEQNWEKYRSSFLGWARGDIAELNPDQLAARKAYTQRLEAILLAGRKAGVLDFPNAPTLARGILGMLNWLARWYRPGGTESATAIAAGYARIVLGGIRRT